MPCGLPLIRLIRAVLELTQDPYPQSEQPDGPTMRCSRRHRSGCCASSGGCAGGVAAELGRWAAQDRLVPCRVVQIGNENMKHFLIGLFLCLLSGLTLSPGYSQVDKKQSSQLTFILSNDQWGTLHTKKIEEVFLSSAEQVWPYFHNRGPISIIIQHSEDDSYIPSVRTPVIPYHVYISAEVFYWAQFAFQFSHEFCHVLCRPELKADNYGRNQWFEESICEAASVFVLRRLDVAWRKDPPFPNLKYFADQNYLRAYSNNLLAPEYRLPRGMTLPQWYIKNSSQLATEWSKANTSAPATLRGANGETGINANRLHARLVGNYLLPFFEDSPQSWESVSYLNVGNKSDRLSFSQYLTAWYMACPKKHQPFVAKIMTAFGVALAPKSSLRHP